MKPLILILPLVFILQTSLACINESESKPKEVEANRSAAAKLQQALAIDLSAKGNTMESELRNATEFQRRSDYAVALIYLGRSKEAVTLLQKLEKERPGEYFVAANLGTAYELSGNNEAALHWIQEGMRRNPESHFGTEWLHVKILEAKIEQGKNPHYFEQNSVLNLQSGSLGKATLAVGDRELPLTAVLQALEYQLGERLQFVKGADMPVASLLFDFARLEAAASRLQSGRDLVKMALQFGFPSAQGEPLLKSYEREIFWSKTKDIGGKVVVALVVIGVLGFLFVKWINRPLYP